MLLVGQSPAGSSTWFWIWSYPSGLTESPRTELESLRGPLKYPTIWIVRLYCACAGFWISLNTKLSTLLRQCDSDQQVTSGLQKPRVLAAFSIWTWKQTEVMTTRWPRCCLCTPGPWARSVCRAVAGPPDVGPSADSAQSGRCPLAQSAEWAAPPRVQDNSQAFAGWSSNRHDQPLVTSASLGAWSRSVARCRRAAAMRVRSARILHHMFKLSFSSGKLYGWDRTVSWLSESCL